MKRRRVVDVSLIGLAVAVGLSAFVSTSVAQETSPDPASRSEVLDSLGIDPVSADYVVIVDTCGSTSDGDLYGQVVGALGPLLQALSTTDHLSRLPLDSTPAIRDGGEVGEPKDRALSQLPAMADGAATDIGAALDAGLRELERPDAADVGAIVLITDGEHAPPAGTAYPSTSGPPWDALATREAL